MVTYRAVVKQGRLVVEEPSTLPEGSVVELYVLPTDDAALDAALIKGWSELEAGKGIPAEDLLKKLRSR